MNFWELIGLPSKRSIVQMQDNTDNIKKQLDRLLEIVVKDDRITSIHNKIDELNEHIEIIKENHTQISNQIQDTTEQLGERIRLCREQIEVSVKDNNSKMFEKHNEKIKELKSELEDMETLLKILAMQGVSKGVEKIVE